MLTKIKKALIISRVLNIGVLLMIYIDAINSFSKDDPIVLKVCRLADKVFGIGENGNDIEFWMTADLPFPDTICLKSFVKELEKEFHHPFPCLEKNGKQFCQIIQLMPYIREDIEKQKENNTMSYKNQEEVTTCVNDILKEYAWCRARKKEIRPYDKIIEDLDLDSLDMVEIALGLEERFSIELCPQIEKTNPTYVTDLVNLICQAKGIVYKKPPRPVQKQKNKLFLFKTKEHTK